MGEWQKVFVNKLIEQVGLTHTDAMEVMGIVCNVRQVAYMEGYDRGWSAAINHSAEWAACTATRLVEKKIIYTNKQSAAITELREAFAEWNETPVEMPSHRLLSAINAVIA